MRTLGLVLTMLFVTSAAGAKPQPRSSEPPPLHFILDGDQVEGELPRADGPVVESLHRSSTFGAGCALAKDSTAFASASAIIFSVRFFESARSRPSSLIRVRTTFVPELLKSAEEI